MARYTARDFSRSITKREYEQLYEARWVYLALGLLLGAGLMLAGVLLVLLLQ